MVGELVLRQRFDGRFESAADVFGEFFSGEREMLAEEHRRVVRTRMDVDRVRAGTVLKLFFEELNQLIPNLRA